MSTREQLLDTSLGFDSAGATDHDAVVLGLFGLHRDGVYRYVRSFGLDAGASEDVVQEVFLALWRHVSGDGDRANLIGWLYRVAHNLALKRRARDRRGSGPAAPAVSGTALGDLSPEERLAGLERVARLRAVVRALPGRERRCLQLRAEGLRYREIAETLGVSLGTVASALTRALARLRRADEV